MTTAEKGDNGNELDTFLQNEIYNANSILTMHMEDISQVPTIT